MPSEISPDIFLGARLTTNKAWRPSISLRRLALFLHPDEYVSLVAAEIDDQLLRLRNIFDRLDCADADIYPVQSSTEMVALMGAGVIIFSSLLLLSCYSYLSAIIGSTFMARRAGR
jgi:hypothetical protein